MGKMKPRGTIRLTLVMLLSLLGCQRGLGQSNPIVYPSTPPYTSRLTNPLVQTTYPFGLQSTYPYEPQSTYPFGPQSSNPVVAATPLPATDNFPGQQGSSSMRPMTPSRTTVPRSNLLPMSPSQTAAAAVADSSPQLLTTLGPLIAKTTGFPAGVTAPSSTPQRVLMTFNNKYSDLGVNEYDSWSNRHTVQIQLAQACQITNDRVTDVYVLPNATGYFVLRFSIQQGYPMYTSQVVEQLRSKAQNQTFMQLNGRPLVVATMVFWTDDGPCPVDRCMNGGQCNVTTSGSYECQCSPGYAGSGCEDAVKPANLSLLALLVLLIIPIAAALVVGFVFGLRRQQKQRLKKAFDLRDVRTIGPKSMLSLPHEPGMRNEMYDTRSFALAFTDTSFGKTSSPPSSSDDDLMSRMG